MEYEAKTEAGKKALEGGADPKVVEGMEADGTLKDEEDSSQQHVDKKGNQPADGEQDDKGDGKGEDEGSGREPVNRNVESIPAWKAKEMAKKAREEGAAEAKAQLQSEFEQKLKEAGAKPGGASDDELKTIAEEFGLKPELMPAFVERLGGVVAKNVKVEGLSSEDRSALDAAKERERLAKEQEGFDEEFNSSETQKALSEISGGKEVSLETRTKLRNLAYSDEFHTYRLTDIIKLKSDSLFPKGEKTAEIGRGGTGQGKAEAKTLDDLTPEEILNMPSDEFKKLSDRLGGVGSRFGKVTTPKK
jgi:hypothetical protein